MVASYIEPLVATMLAIFSPAVMVGPWIEASGTAPGGSWLRRPSAVTPVDRFGLMPMSPKTLSPSMKIDAMSMSACTSPCR